MKREYNYSTKSLCLCTHHFISNHAYIHTCLAHACAEGLFRLAIDCARREFLSSVPLCSPFIIATIDDVEAVWFSPPARKTIL